MSGARKRHGRHWRPFLKRRRASTPQTPYVSVLFGVRVGQPARATKRFIHTGVVARVERNTRPHSVGLCRPHWRKIQVTQGGSRTHRHNPGVGTMVLVPTSAQPSATARARDRDGARGRPARCDPTATRARQPRDYQHLPAGHRQRRDHHHGPRTTVADDLRHRWPPTAAIGASAIGSVEPAWADPMPHPSVAISRSIARFHAAPAFPMTQVVTGVPEATVQRRQCPHFSRWRLRGGARRARLANVVSASLQSRTRRRYAAK